MENEEGEVLRQGLGLHERDLDWQRKRVPQRKLAACPWKQGRVMEAGAKI